VDGCVGIVAELERRRIARYHYGQWTNRVEPMKAETSQRQTGVDLLNDSVDCILQLDNDEVLPDPAALLGRLTLPVTGGSSASSGQCGCSSGAWARAASSRSQDPTVGPSGSTPGPSSSGPERG